MAEAQEKWLKTRLIIEIAGSPKEHVDKTLLLLGEKFGEGDPEIKVTKRSVKEPTKIEKSKDLWSGFIEFEADVKYLSTLIGIIFDYLPSSVEILEPEEFVTQTPYINGILNDLAAKMHQYDATIKMLKAEIALLRKKLKTLPDAQKPPASGQSNN
ncbi:MAG: hypothetical protein QW063_02995 [Candidatus Nanoarchaeia archaeon]